MSTIKLKRLQKEVKAVKEVKDEEGNVTTPAVEGITARYAEVVSTTNKEDVEVNVQRLDNEVLGCESRIKNLKAKKTSLQAFISKDVDEGEEPFNPSKETV